MNAVDLRPHRGRIEAGIDWLNEQAEQGNLTNHWFWDIDMNRLWINSGRDCVLGQLFEWEAIHSDGGSVLSGYGYARGVLGLSIPAAYAYGFDRDPMDPPNTYSELEAEWRIQINELRETFPRD